MSGGQASLTKQACDDTLQEVGKSIMRTSGHTATGKEQVQMPKGRNM